jgi:hypothetical protein
MKKTILAIMVAAVLAAPCIYDVLSNEPSPLAGIVALSASASW